MTGLLRLWQRECIDSALIHYETERHFLCHATPGAGKTRMAAVLSEALLASNKIDLIFCFAPSLQVVEGMRATFSSVLGGRLDGLIGALGAAFSYQAMEYRSEAFWRLLDDYRVFVVFDEIHHCAGSDFLFSNAWGQQILKRLQDQAAYTLALSGTPWRSDDRPIALARYTSPEGRLVTDYKYGLREAVRDGVCRSPRIVLLDNQQVGVAEKARGERTFKLYPSIAQLLLESSVTYQHLLQHEEVIMQMLRLGCEKLTDLSRTTPNAAGLVVATDIDHANQIVLLLETMGESCYVLTTEATDAQQKINCFKAGGPRWIVAVGMISEGTDIPRLQVCCYLSRIRTELYFRQVLGRILRRIGEADGEAWFFSPAETTLKKLAERIAEDLPEDNAVLRKVELLDADATFEEVGLKTGGFDEIEVGIEPNPNESLGGDTPFHNPVSGRVYEISFSAHYRQELLSCF
ncbi:MAG: diguanylate cyclase [Rhodobacteraceae bacterium]|nr:diguanylate cyclase [Paracoccaceae bacterium]